jgi:hemerythrin superfamily protein
VPNGIDLILADHRTVDELFADFAKIGDAGVIGQVVDALKAHDDAEQVALYPFALEVLGDEKLLVRAKAAHSAVKRQIDELAGLEGAPLADAFAGLRRLVAEHVKDEERSLLPALQAACTVSQLDGLGARILQAKQRGG